LDTCDNARVDLLHGELRRAHTDRIEPPRLRIANDQSEPAFFPYVLSGSPRVRSRRISPANDELTLSLGALIRGDYIWLNAKGIGPRRSVVRAATTRTHPTRIKPAVRTSLAPWTGTSVSGAAPTAGALGKVPMNS